MKKKYLIAVLIILSGCSSNSNKMIVTGNIDGLKKGTVYLQKQQDSIIVSLDSINIDGSSEFILKTRLEEPDIFYLYLDKYDGDSLNDIITFFGNKLFSFIGKIMFRLNITDILFTYLLGKTESFKKLDLKYHDFRICVEIPIKVAKFKMIYDSLPSFERKRKGGVKKVNAIKDGFLILIAILKLFFVQK